MKKAHIWAIIIVVAALAVWYANGNSKKQVAGGQPIKIGAALGLTGDAAAWGEASLNGIKMAIAEINSTGGVNGRPMELVVDDSKSSSKDTVSAVTKLRDFDKVDAFMATWLDSYQGAENLIPQGKIMLSGDSGVEGVNGQIKHKGIFSTWYRTEVKSDVAVKHMAEHGIKKMYIIVQNDSYYVTVAQFMAKSAKKYGIEVVGTEMMNSGADIKTALVKVNASKADALFFAVYDEKISTEFFKRKSANLQSSMVVYGDELISDSYKNPSMKGLFEGVYFYAPKIPDQKFYDAYVKTYKTEPFFGAGTSYDAVKILAKMFAENPSDADAYLRNNKFETVSYGTITFDDLGGVVAKDDYFVIKKITNGEPVISN